MFSMLATPLQRAVKIKRIVTDNEVFNLHYQATCLLLIFFSILVTSTQYFGDPIDCVQHDAIPNNVLKTFCWIHSTFNVPEAYNKTVGTQGIAYPGIQKFTPGENRRYYMYYQWVAMTLFFQAICFYAPHYIWRLYENGLMKNLVMDLDCPIKDRGEVCQKAEIIAKYVYEHIGMHKKYFKAYVICEFLNLINVIGQVWLTDKFLGNMFTSFGTRVLQYHQYNPEVRNDPMSQLFPRMTKCTFHLFGTSGDIQKHDALCMLAQNIINEKIYIFLWFWWVILFVITLLGLAYRVTTIMMPKFRTIMLRHRARITDRRSIDMVMKRISASDWWLLYMLAKNMNPVYYRVFLIELSKKLADDDDRLLKGRSEDSNTSTV